NDDAKVAVGRDRRGAPPAASREDKGVATQTFRWAATGPTRGLIAIRALQNAAGNAAVARALAVQREFDLREYTGHTPANPYTHIHFRFDTTTLPGYPHEHLHITVSVGGGNPKVHYYYDGWT